MVIPYTFTLSVGVNGPVVNSTATGQAICAENAQRYSIRIPGRPSDPGKFRAFSIYVPSSGVRVYLRPGHGGNDTGAVISADPNASYIDPGLAFQTPANVNGPFDFGFEVATTAGTTDVICTLWFEP